MTKITAVDDAMFRAEQVIVGGMLLIMGGAVFIDVLHRQSNSPGQWLATSWFVGLVAGILVLLALRTRSVAWVHALWIAAVSGLAVGLGQKALIYVFPNGFIWSKDLASSMMLWLGTMGASLAAHERRHLSVDIGMKVWPKAWAPKVQAIGHLLTAAFCILLLLLGAQSVLDHWDAWSVSGYAGDTVTSLNLPRWVPALAIPYGMIVLTWRFGLEAVRSWFGWIEEDEDEALHQLGLKAEDLK